MILALLAQVPRLHPEASEPLSPPTFMEVMADICLSLVPYAESFPLRRACILQESEGMGSRLVRRPDGGVEAGGSGDGGLGAIRQYGGQGAVWKLASA